MSKEGIARLQSYIDTGEYLVHGSPVPGLTVLEPHAHPQVRATGIDGQPMPLPAVVHAAANVMVPLFVAVIWSKDGLSGYHTFNHPRYGIHYRFNAAPQVIRDARNRLGWGYPVRRTYFRERPQAPGSYMATGPVPVAHAAEPFCLADFTPTLLVGAEVSPEPPNEPMPAFAELSPKEQQYYSYKWVFERPDNPAMKIAGYNYRPMLCNLRVLAGSGVYSTW